MSILGKFFRVFRYHYSAGGVAVRGKNLSFLTDARFEDAYRWSSGFSFNGRQSTFSTLDLRWKAHVCVWAAHQGLRLDGEFVECGVDTAIFSGVILKFLDFANISNKEFYLFDTYEGIPLAEGMTLQEEETRKSMNKNFYFDSYSFVSEKVKSFPNVKLVKGVVPASLAAIEGRKIAYLSVDLNNAPAEMAAIHKLWGNLSPGAVVVLDDYAFKGHEDQYEAWNSFARLKQVMIVTLPTGQGLMIKPPDAFPA